IISNYNKGVQNNFPSVQLVNNSKDVENLVRDSNLIDQKELIAEGIRNVMLKHTSFHRMSKIFKVLGKNYEIKNSSILVVGEGDKVEKSFNRQLYNNVHLISNETFEDDPMLIDKYNYIAFFSNDIEYGEYYLENLLSSFAYMNADVVTMNHDYYKYDSQDSYIKTTSLIASEKYHKVDNKDADIRYFNIPETELIKDENYLNESLSSEKLLTIIIPVNNDEIRSLESKTLYSLRKMDIRIEITPYTEVSSNNKILLERLE